jgi:hypothetical protein
MEANVSKTDATVRWMLAAILFGIAIMFNAYVLLSFFSVMAALLMAATALTRRCMFYTLIGFITHGRRPVAS